LQPQHSEPIHTETYHKYDLEQDHHGTMSREEPKKSTIRTIAQQQKNLNSAQNGSFFSKCLRMSEKSSTFAAAKV